MSKHYFSLKYLRSNHTNETWFSLNYTINNFKINFFTKIINYGIETEQRNKNN